jgi:hypothetical protein
MLRTLVQLLPALILSACASVRYEFPERLHGAAPREGVVLVAGLNMRFEALHELANALEARGAVTEIVEIAPHVEHTALLIDEALKRAHGLFSNVRVVGYSTGALLVLDKIFSGKVAADLVTLIAPPLRLKTIPRAALSLAEFLPSCIRILSASHRDYRKRAYTTVAEYRSVLRLMARVEALATNTRVHGAGIHAVIHRDDSLIHAQETVQRLSALQIPVTVLTERSGSSLSPHRATDSHALSVTDFRRVVDVILR